MHCKSQLHEMGIVVHNIPRMGITPQNMPQTSNSLLSPTQWLLRATNGNHGQTVMHL